ncbi:MAG: hypothetical protein Q6354_01120 [Candidatus Brocadiales bacterium]|nr:hypothetical protein [Candidatus Brocadiales bacterium]
MRFRMVVLVVLCGALIFTAGRGFLGTIKATGNEACGGCKAAGAAKAGSAELTAEACCGECGKVNKVFHEIQTALRLSDVQMDTLKWVLDRYGVRLEGEGMCQRCEEEREEAEGAGMCGMCKGEGEKEALEEESEEEERAEMEADKKIIELLEKITENTNRIYQVLEKGQ